MLATLRARTSHIASSSDYRDRRRSATTKEKLLSTNIQPSFKDLAIKTTPPETHRHQPFPQARAWKSFCLHQNNIKTPTSLDQALGGTKSFTTLGLGEQNHPRLPLASKAQDFLALSLEPFRRSLSSTWVAVFANTLCINIVHDYFECVQGVQKSFS
jgi:hypothetical protein